MKAHDPVARFPAVTPRADGHYSPRNFMPENLRGGDKSVLDFFQVCAADAAGRHAN